MSKSLGISLAACAALALTAYAGIGSPEPAPVVMIEPEPALRTIEDLARGRRWELHWGAVAAYDVASGELQRRVELPGAILSGARDSGAPDIVLDRRGALIASSNTQPVAWRISPARFEVERIELAVDADSHLDFGFTDLAWSRDGARLCATATPAGTRWRLDLGAGTAARQVTCS